MLGGGQREFGSFPVSLFCNRSHALLDRLFDLETFRSLLHLQRPSVRGKEAQEDDKAEKVAPAGGER